MPLAKGKLIVLEGTDGSGKSVQTKMLLERIQKEGYRVATVSFPQYAKKSSGLIEEYLNGKYGEPDKVNPYAASLFYALDRFDLSSEIKSKLAEGIHLVVDRYVDSNAGHQGGKIRDPQEREKFIKWLYETEYGILGIPRPDLVIILHVPAQISQKLIAQKQQRLYIENNKKFDKHEENLEHLKNAEESYLWLAKNYPENHKLIECTENEKLLTPEEIHAKVWEVLQPILKE